MKPLFLLFIIISFASLKATDPDIVGVWESKFGNNELFTMRFRKDSTFKGFINKKSFTNDGTYTFSNNILNMENDFCKDAKEYDSCTSRKETSFLLRMGRVKT